MKNQEQVLLAVLLLALTSMSACAGGLNNTEEFFEEDGEECPEGMMRDESGACVPSDTEQFAGNNPDSQMSSSELEEEDNLMPPNEEFVQNSGMESNSGMQPAGETSVEGFTGGMYAGF